MTERVKFTHIRGHLKNWHRSIPQGLQMPYNDFIHTKNTMTDTWKKWNIRTSIYLFEYCVYSWRNLMYPHIHGFEDEEMMKELFWHYLNYGNSNTYYD